jgi:hypothetical protein
MFTLFFYDILFNAAVEQVRSGLTRLTCITILGRMIVRFLVAIVSPSRRVLW